MDMKILVIGDPHGVLPKKIPKNIDLILITGDIGKADLARKRYFENLKRKEQGLPEIDCTNHQRKKEFMEVYNSAIKIVKYLSKYAPVYTIFGNADISNYETRKKSRKIGSKLPFLINDLKSIKNVKVINNRVANFNGLKIGGLEYFVDTNWVREFKPSDYKDKLEEAKKETQKAQKILNWFSYYDLDVILCHQPPYGFLDESNFSGAPAHWKGKHAGSKAILNYIKREQPKYVFCGHIHEAKGKAKIGKTEVYNVGNNGDYILIDI